MIKGRLAICFLMMIQVYTNGVGDVVEPSTHQLDNNSQKQTQFDESSQIDETSAPLNERTEELKEPYNYTYNFTGYQWYDKGSFELEVDFLDPDLHDRILFNKEICECSEFDYVEDGCGLNCSPFNYSRSQQMWDYMPAIMSSKPTMAARWPYLISFQTNENSNKPNCYRHFCGGSLITPNLVLTAAHCFKNLKYLEYRQYDGTPKKDIYAAQFPQCRHAGSDPKHAAGKRAQVTYIYIHPDWDPFIGNADIAIIVLDTFFKGPYVTLNTNDAFPEEVPLKIAGYGAVNQQEVLQSAIYNMRRPLEEEVDYISYEKCRSLLKQFNGTTYLREDTMICAYNINGDTCQGDSGGPLAKSQLEQINFYPILSVDVLVGVISWGPPDQCKSRFSDQAPVVATKVSAFVHWINDTLDSYRTSISSLSDNQINQKMQNPEVEYLEYQIFSLEEEKNYSWKYQRVEYLKQQISEIREQQIQSVRHSKATFFYALVCRLSPQLEFTFNYYVTSDELNLTISC